MSTANTSKPRSIKDLLCDACGREEATAEGYCDGCRADIEAAIDERARYYVGDPEGECFLAGIRP